MTRMAHSSCSCQASWVQIGDRLTADKSSVANQHTQNLLSQLRSVRDVCLSSGAIYARDPFSELASRRCNRIARSKHCRIGLCVDAGGCCSAFAEIACHNKSIPRGRPARSSAFGPWLRNLLEKFPQKRFYWRTRQPSQARQAISARIALR